MAMPARPAPRLMGIVNVTPDSFSDGGAYLDARAAVAHGIELARQGAHILDIGGESTRPGAEPVSETEELERVIPVIEGLREAGVAAQLSVDTRKAAVAAAALAAGASIVNDVSALREDPQMAEVIARAGAWCVLMHMRGEPGTMQDEPRYSDVVGEVREFLRERAEEAQAAGIARERIMLDPGIGFGKTVRHNLELLQGTGEIAGLGMPVVVGTSRKAFLGRIAADARGLSDPLPPQGRLAGTIATNVIALERGASVFRVHDVGPVADALAVAADTLLARWTESAAPATTAT